MCARQYKVENWADMRKPAKLRVIVFGVGFRGEGRGQVLERLKDRNNLGQIGSVWQISTLPGHFLRETKFV